MVHASKWFRSVRWLFLGAVIVAAALTAFTLFLGYAVADWMIDEPGWNRPWRWLVNNVGSSMVMTVTGVLLFPVYYWLASRRPVRELQQLAGAVERLSAGYFDIRLPARRRDEIGVIAEALRRYADGLDKRLDELTAGLREIGEADSIARFPSGAKAGWTRWRKASTA
jgi:methyl-accepting chemotaxis protein